MNSVSSVVEGDYVDTRGHPAGATIYDSESGLWSGFLTLVIHARSRANDLRPMLFALPVQAYMAVSTLAPAPG